ncbi:MAG: hypothetical protein AABW80_01005 [Nanoarchaeota archaeon]
MQRNFKKFSRFSRGPAPTVHCACGGEAKKKVRRNYPFGKESKCRYTKYYKCSVCQKRQGKSV